MKKSKISLKYEQKEFLHDVKNVIISYTPLSGIFDTLKFLNKWLIKRRHVHRFGKKVNGVYRRFILENIAKRQKSNYKLDNLEGLR